MRYILFNLIIFFLFNSSLEAQSIKLVFRYDDFTLTTDSLNEGVVNIFQKHHIHLVLGVIPCDKNEKLVLEQNYPFLQQLKNGVKNHSIEIALHGLNHQKIGNGEFGNIDKKEQYRRMNKGKLLLDSIFAIKVLTFIPPWNAYDENTLMVMQQLGFKVISSALCVGQAFSNDSITYFPHTVADLNQLPCVLSQNKNRDGIIVVMFHSYDFDKLYSLTKLDGLLSNIEKMKNVRCVSFEQLYSTNQISDKKRMLANLQSNLLSKYLHLNGMIQTTFYATFIRILNVLLYVLLSMILYFISIQIISKKKPISNNRKYITASLFIVIVAWAVWVNLLAPLKLLALCLALATSLPLLLTIKLKK